MKLRVDGLVSVYRLPGIPNFFFFFSYILRDTVNYLQAQGKDGKPKVSESTKPQSNVF